VREEDTMPKTKSRMENLIEEIHAELGEQNGWVPKTARDYGILCWSSIQEIKEDIKYLRGLDGRIVKLETGFGLVVLAVIGLALKMIFKV
jgi:hypothetical protein